jgi:[ribosomal protein S5]-alanine N-acetyltransferase
MPGMRLQLIPYTPALAEAWQAGRLAEQLGLAALPDGWPMFPQGLSAEWAREVPAHGPTWGPHLFLDPAGPVLLGNGGFKGAPAEGGVEIGYEIAPEHRSKGWAQAAVQALLALAWTEPAVHRVLAHTLAEENPSTGVLRACGFRQVHQQPHATLGAIWRWCRER